MIKKVRDFYRKSLIFCNFAALFGKQYKLHKINKMNYLRKTLFLLVFLLSFAPMAWTQMPINVSNETELQTALSNGTINAITLVGNINLYSELESSQTNIIDLNGYTLDCKGYHIHVTGETLVIQSNSGGGTIIGRGTDAGCTFYVESGATLDIEAGNITARKTVNNGGVIYNAGTLEINGGVISGGQATNGGGVFNTGTLDISGGTISNNTVSGQGGAIYSTGTLKMRGNPIIFGNATTNSENSNVYLSSGKVISVTGVFANSASIGVTMADGFGIFTTGFKNHNSSNPDETFSSDNSSYIVTLDGDEASLCASFNEVFYVDRSWDNVNHVVTEEALPCSNFTKLEGSNSNSSTELDDGWYVVYRNVSYKKCLKMVGNVHLILVDGATLTVKDGIYIKKDKTFTVYGQSEGSGKIYAHPDSGPGIGGMKNTVAGHFVVKGGTIDAKAGSKKNSGIGGGNGDSGIQSVTIYGGTVKAEGKKCGAGIGKGLDNNVWEVVTIYGGDVTAIGGENGAGIGGGEDRGNGRVEIWGGTVTAQGGGNSAGIGGGLEGSQDKPVVIHGGTVTATGGYCAAGIGGGCGDKFWSWSDVNGGRGGTVIINGGTVTAKAGKRNLTGAGIGGGKMGTNGDITINGGFVWASTPEDPKFVGAAIGAGDDKKQGGDIVINGGEVVATSYGYGAGIGGGKESKGGNIHITNGEVTAISVYGAGIGGGGDDSGSDGGDGGNITIDGGQIFAMSAAKGAGIGGGNDGNGGTITINDGYVKAVGGYCKYSFFEDNGPTFINLGYDVNPVYSMAAAAVMTIFEELVHMGTFGGAGIGGGDDGKGGTIHINGGTVVAKGGRSSCSAIGKGDGGSSNGKLDIYDDARVFAGNDSIIQLANNRISACQSNQYATIMPCPHENATYIIYDNEMHLEHCLNCNHTALKPHTFDNYSTCIHCGYGQGTHTVTIYMPVESGDGTYESVSYTVGHGRDIQLPESISRIGALQFVGWMQGTPVNVQSYVWLDYEPLCAENGIYSNVTSDLSFIARYKEYWNGTGMGSADDPYLIATTDDLDQLATRVNNGQDFQGRHFLLTANLEYDGTTNNYTTVGTQVGSQYKAFNGTFDGNGHSISGINIYSSNNFIGVFGLLGTQGTITRLTVNDCSFKGNVYVGGIVGANEGTVDHCLVLGGTIQGSDECGHIIGYNNRRAFFNYYIANDNINGIGENSTANTAPNIFGGNKGYTISCTEGLVFKYVKGSVTGSEDDALIEYDGTLYVAAGVTVSFEVNYQTGYSLEYLLCNGTEITPNNQGIYTITMPEANVVITSTLLQPTFITAGSWDDEANWSNGLPSMGSDVVIAAPATIESSEDVGYITIREGGSITIADGGQLIHTNDVTATLQKEIIAYTDNSDGWFTIASPSTYNFPVSNLVTESAYDLYLYHEPTHYWRNSKDSDNNFVALQPRQGYLYANAENITLSFMGNMLGTNNTVTIPLDYTDAAGSLKGFNLVGNPFTRRLTGSDVIRIGDDAFTTYLIAEGDGELVPYTLAERDIEPGEGFFVQATTTNQSLVINDATRGEQTKWQPSYLRIEAGKEGCYDRAYVQMGGGNTLRKMSLGEKTPKVSVWHDGKDWSSVTIEAATGELPVNFKATENGTYTILVNVNGLKVDYLHLIDNLTGADVDLLVPKLVEGPATYTFTSKTTDYESRFRLVFSAQSTESVEGQDPTFAFVSNGNIIVSGEGILQVVDMMGRIIYCRDAKSCVSTAGMPSGVYVLRLIQGDKVKTQKIVIE